MSIMVGRRDELRRRQGVASPAGEAVATQPAAAPTASASPAPSAADPLDVLLGSAAKHRTGAAHATLRAPGGARVGEVSSPTRESARW
jgi:hypothetical protein